jgi:hypothetical protein
VSREALVGRWSLVSYEIAYPGQAAVAFLGDDPVGLLAYDADGRLWVQFGRRDRPRLSTDDYLGAPAGQKVAAFDSAAAYCGTWELVERAGVVVHRVELAWNPNWTGTEQRRHYALDGDTLTLSSDKGWSSSRLVWRRLGVPPPGV